MSSSNETCEFVLDPDNPETWGRKESDEQFSAPSTHVRGILDEDGVWSCPHAAEEDEDLCIFHLPLDKKDEREVVDAFLDSIGEVSEGSASTPYQQNQQFLGARFGTFDLDNNLSGSVTAESGIFLSYAEIDGAFNWSEMTVNIGPLHFDHVVFSGPADLSETVFRSSIHFQNAVFEGQTNFNEAGFERYTNFTFTIFQNEIMFSKAEFNGLTTFEGSKFENKADFDQATFEVVIDPSHTKIDNIDTRFTGSKFENSVTFKRTIFRGRTDFGNVEFDAADFMGAEFQRDVFFIDSRCQHVVDFEKTLFDGIASFLKVEFSGRVADTGGELQGEIVGGAGFTGASFNDEINFTGSTLENASFENVNLSDARFNDARLCHANLESALLSRSTLFDADLRGTKLSGAVLGDARIDEDTRFLGHPDKNSYSSPHTLSALRSKPSCVYDPNYEKNNVQADVDKAKSVYRALEELAGKAARPRLQAQCFVRRQDLQKDGYRQDAKEADSLQEKLIAGARYTRAKVARGTLLYGESPWRIIGGSISFIFLLSLLYPLGEWLRPVGGEPITYSRILGGEPGLLLDSLYFSTLTFTTLGMGDYEPIGIGQVLVILNTALGAVLIALLVFVLGRRAAR